MRRVVAALALLTAGGAQAEESYTLPPVGAELTYRLVLTTKLADAGRAYTAGQVYTYLITAVNGPTVEGIIKPVAVIYGCLENDTSKDCAFATKAAGAQREHDLVTVPVPKEIAEALAKDSRYKGRYFITEERKFPLPGARNPDDPSDTEFGAAPVYVLSSTLLCDYEQLKGFLPFGKTPRLSLPCQSIFALSQSRLAAVTARTTEEKLSAEFTDDGAAHLDLPSGGWDVHKVGLKFVPGDPSHATAESELYVAPKLGIAVKTHTVTTNPSHSVAETDSELIAVKP
jgi:hypothetical protein